MGCVIADSNYACSLVLWFEHCGMTDMLPHAWDTRGGLKGLPSSQTSAIYIHICMYIYMRVYKINRIDYNQDFGSLLLEKS